MKQYHAQCAKVMAKPGQRDELVRLLTQSSELLKDVPDCLYYLIGTTDEADAICISELWTSKEAKDAFGTRPDVAEAMKSTFLPLLASMDKPIITTMVAGVGVAWQ